MLKTGLDHVSKTIDDVVALEPLVTTGRREDGQSGGNFYRQLATCLAARCLNHAEKHPEN